MTVVDLAVSVSVCVSVCLCVCVSVYLCACVPVCLCLCAWSRAAPLHPHHACFSRFIYVSACLCARQHSIYDLLFGALVEQGLHYQLHQLLQYHVIDDSKYLVRFVCMCVNVCLCVPVCVCVCLPVCLCVGRTIDL